MKPHSSFDEMQKASFERGVRGAGEGSFESIASPLLRASKQCLVVVAACAAGIALAMWLDHMATKAIAEAISARGIGRQW